MSATAPWPPRSAEQKSASAAWNGCVLLPAKADLLDKRLTPKMRRAILRRNAVGVIPYAVATAGAALTPYITLVICGLVAAFYALPATTGLDLPTQS